MLHDEHDSFNSQTESPKINQKERTAEDQVPENPSSVGARVNVTFEHSDCSQTGRTNSCPPNTEHVTQDNNDITNEDNDTVYNLLESIHRLNCLLVSKEEEALTLGSTVHMVSDQGQDQSPVDSDQVRTCFNEEVARYRDMNARMLYEIQDNTGMLAEMSKNTDIRRKMVTQLEFDVNIIERESKRLQV